MIIYLFLYLNLSKITEGMLNIVYPITISCCNGWDSGANEPTDGITRESLTRLSILLLTNLFVDSMLRAIDNRFRDLVSFAVSSIYRTCRSKWQTISAALFSRLGEDPILCTCYFLFRVMFLLVHHDFSLVTLSPFLLLFSFFFFLCIYCNVCNRDLHKNCII